jgi:hypothetical protein
VDASPIATELDPAAIRGSATINASHDLTLAVSLTAPGSVDAAATSSHARTALEDEKPLG